MALVCKKVIQPIKEELLTEEFIEVFNKGHLSMQSPSITCPHCGEIGRAATFAMYEDASGRRISELQCPSCKGLIDDAGMTQILLWISSA